MPNDNYSNIINNYLNVLYQNLPWWKRAWYELRYYSGQTPTQEEMKITLLDETDENEAKKRALQTFLNLDEQALSEMQQIQTDEVSNDLDNLPTVLCDSLKLVQHGAEKNQRLTQLNDTIEGLASLADKKIGALSSKITTIESFEHEYRDTFPDEEKHTMDFKEEETKEQEPQQYIGIVFSNNRSPFSSRSNLQSKEIEGTRNINNESIEDQENSIRSNLIKNKPNNMQELYTRYIGNVNTYINNHRLNIQTNKDETLIATMKTSIAKSIIEHYNAQHDFNAFSTENFIHNLRGYLDNPKSGQPRLRQKRVECIERLWNKINNATSLIDIQIHLNEAIKEMSPRWVIFFKSRKLANKLRYLQSNIQLTLSIDDAEPNSVQNKAENLTGKFNEVERHITTLNTQQALINEITNQYGKKEIRAFVNDLPKNNLKSNLATLIDELKTEKSQREDIIFNQLQQTIFEKNIKTGNLFHIIYSGRNNKAILNRQHPLTDHLISAHAMLKNTHQTDEIIGFMMQMIIAFNEKKIILEHYSHTPEHFNFMEAFSQALEIAKIDESSNDSAIQNTSDDDRGNEEEKFSIDNPAILSGIDEMISELQKPEHSLEESKKTPLRIQEIINILVICTQLELKENRVSEATEILCLASQLKQPYSYGHNNIGSFNDLVTSSTIIRESVIPKLVQHKDKLHIEYRATCNALMNSLLFFQERQKEEEEEEEKEQSQEIIAENNSTIYSYVRSFF